MSHAAAVSGIAAAQPAASGALIDRAHLARMTLGDANLEREILNLFERQAELLIGRMRSLPPAAVQWRAQAFAPRGAGAARSVSTG